MKSTTNKKSGKSIPGPVDLNKRYIDLGYLSELTNNNCKIMVQIINLYLQQTPSLISMMKKGLAEKDCNLLQRSVHKLIPSFSIMGIDKSYEMMAKNIQSIAEEEMPLEEAGPLMLEMETVCLSACAELKEEIKKLETGKLMNERQIKIFLVDDDALYLKTLETEFLQHADLTIETYATGEACLEHIGTNPDIIILDHYLDSIDKNAMNGMEVLDKIKAINSDIPVIMLSSQDKIEVAIEYMHHGAYDYVVKSETAFMRLQKIISNIFSYKKMKKELSWYMDRM
jgi:two-component system OmpR family response regulator